jgi:ABC-type multidrug transport system ATPase subunit
MKCVHTVELSFYSGGGLAHRKAFTWERLNYTVPIPGGTRKLLHDVNGYVKPGTLTALMGASGAGELQSSVSLTFHFG